jgi:hypothetical protein
MPHEQNNPIGTLTKEDRTVIRRAKMMRPISFIKIWREFDFKPIHHHGFSEAHMIDLLSQSVGIENIRTSAESFGKQRRNQDSPNPYWRHGQGQYAFSEYMMKHPKFNRGLRYGKGRMVIIDYNGTRTRMTLLKNGRRIKGVTIKGIEHVVDMFHQSKHSAGQSWFNNIHGDEFRTYGMDNCPAFQCAQKFAGFNPKTMPNFQQQIRQFIKSVIDY